MFSTLTERGARATLDALELGASDYVTKPANVGSVTASIEAVRSQLLPRIHSLCARVAAPRRAPVPSLAPMPVRPLAPARPRTSTDRVDVVAIGSSTGGPDALSVVLAALPADLGVPVVVVQHMPPVFTGSSPTVSTGRCRCGSPRAVAGDAVAPGRVLVAPGDHHLRFRGSHALGGLRGGHARPGHARELLPPAVDVMFRSVVETWGGHVLAVVLTGMGSDGASGSAAVVARRRFGHRAGRGDPVVWGMPRAVVAAGVPAQVLPLDRIGPAIVERVRRGRHAPLTTRETVIA